MVRIKINSEKGLTVIELLIFTSILAIITIFGVPALSNALSPSEFQRGIPARSLDCCKMSFCPS